LKRPIAALDHLTEFALLGNPLAAPTVNAVELRRPPTLVYLEELE